MTNFQFSKSVLCLKFGIWKLFVIWCLVIVILLPQAVRAAQPISESTTVSASIGEYRFFLFGYASPRALVTLEGIGIFDQTYADKTGYFAFVNRFSPFSPREACLSARDQLGRLSNPVCLPPFPVRYNVTIGPVVLPPTISLDKTDYFIGDEVVLSGQTIPNTDVNLSVFVDEKRSFLRYLSDRPRFPAIVKPAYAFTFPQLQIKSDAKGNFSITLPSANPDLLRLFAQTEFKKENSPKSITLNVKVLPIWMLIIKIFGFLWSLIKSKILEIIIILQIAALAIYFLRRYLHPHAIAVNKAIVLLKKNPLLKL